MRSIQLTWYSKLSQSFTILYQYFFDPDAFMHQNAIKDRTTRLRLFINLLPSMFLIIYPLCLFLAFIFSGLQFHWYDFITSAAGLLSGLLIGACWEVLMKRPIGIAGGMWIGLWLGMWAMLSWTTWLGILFTTFGGLALGSGIVQSIGKVTIADINKNIQCLEDIDLNNQLLTDNPKSFFDYFAAFAAFLMLYATGGTNPPLKYVTVMKMDNIIKKYFGVVALSLLGVFIVNLVTPIFTSHFDISFITGPAWWALLLGSGAGLLTGVVLNRAYNQWVAYGLGIGSGIVIGWMSGNFSFTSVFTLIFSILPVLIVVLSWYISLRVAYNTVKATNPNNKMCIHILLLGIILGIITTRLSNNIWNLFLFPLCYALAYSQLPLLLVSYRSLNIALTTIIETEHFNSRTNRVHKSVSEPPQQVSGQESKEFEIQEQDIAISQKESSLTILSLLHTSSLYWDEWEFLPIAPFLKLEEVMSSAMQKDMIQTLPLLQFIQADRPLLFESAQKGALKGLIKLMRYTSLKESIFKDVTQLRNLIVLLDLTYSIEWLEYFGEAVVSYAIQDVEQAKVLLEIIIIEEIAQEEALLSGLQSGLLNLISHEMQPAKTLRDISETGPHFTQLEQLSADLDISGLGEVFEALYHICQTAVHYLSSLGWQARCRSLEQMLNYINTLKDRPPQIPKLDAIIVDYWQSTIQHELDKLQQEPHHTDQINNPYIVGQALQPGTTLFVGRRDLVQQLEQGLGRGSHRLTFFLNGERRMGKSSTLRQLPKLLDTHHFLPLFFDLQSPEIISSIAAFLSIIADTMTEALTEMDIQVASLESKQLQEAQNINDAQVYYIFGEWLKKVEVVLKHLELVVLLSFDEFENLEQAGKANYLNLHLLLNWFRSLIQNHPQLALLFSGGKSVSEIGQETGFNWSGYFVNVQTFRVSFLREAEARRLITKPIPDYPIEQIFGSDVVDGIIRTTACHPFLVQAICSNIVNTLNTDGRDRAELEDVENAVTQLLDDWGDSYFQDLWTRSEEEQRACLIALHELGSGNFQAIYQHIYKLNETSRTTLQNLRHNLQILLKRDLIVQKAESYYIATPIFNKWVERNS